MEKIKAVWKLIQDHTLMFHEFVVVPLVLLILLGVYYLGKHTGAEEAFVEFEARAQAELSKADKAYRKLEEQHADRVHKIELQYAEKLAANRALDARVSSDIGSGARRVRVRAARCADVPTSAAAPGPAHAEASCELPPEIGKRLYDLAADCDATAEQLNALQQWAVSAVILGNQLEVPPEFN